MKALTVKDIYKLCQKQIKLGNGDKVVMISDDDEGNGYHYVWYEFSSVEQAGAEDSICEDIATKEDTIILG